MVLNFIFNAKRIIALISTVVFLVVSCSDASQKEQSSVKKTFIFEPEFSKTIDSLQIYYRQYQLVKMAKLLYKVEPKVDDNSAEMGVLSFYKGLLYEEINDNQNYQKADEKLAKITQSLQNSDEKALLASYVLNNKIASASNSGSKEEEKLTLASLDTLESVHKKYRDGNYYFRKGSSTYLLAGYYLGFQDYNKAEKYNILTRKYMDSTGLEYNKVYPYYIKGLILANQKKPKEALVYYHKVIELAQEKHSTRFLRNIYPALNTSYNELGDYQSAAKYMLKYKMTNDTVLKAQKLATDFVIEKEKEMNQQADDKKLLISIILGLVLLIVLFFTGKKLLKSKVNAEEESFISVATTDTVSHEDLHELVELSKNNENVFYLKFPEYNPFFIKDLNSFSPKLSDSEIKFCMYLSMKYTVKEIALYTNTSIKSVESKKYRLKKKINTAENEELAKRLNL